MFWLLAIFTFVSQLPLIAASFHCFKCSQTLVLNSFQSITITRPECQLKNETSTMCTAELRIDYEQNNASVLFDGLSQDLLNVSDGTVIITHNMQILFDRSRLQRTLQVYCFRNLSCIENINEIYWPMGGSQITKLRDNLQSQLFNASDSANLLCENNQNRTVPCPNGFCQLINDGESGFTRNCIPNDFPAYPPGIFIGSSTVEDFEKESPFMYTCNQDMCNNLEMAEKVQRLLAGYGLLTPVNIRPINELQTTTSIRTSIAVRMIPQTMIGGIQCLVLFIMTIFI